MSGQFDSDMHMPTHLMPLGEAKNPGFGLANVLN
jgi:hypothetical protein